MTTKPLSIWLIVLLASMIATTPLAIDMYLPAMPTIAHDLNAHISTVQQSLSVFLAAYSFGMLLFGPLADALGRRPLALFGLSGFVLASLALSQAESIEWFLSLRALQALAGSASSVVVPGIIRYLYREHTAKGMSYMSLIMMLAPLLAPSIGSGLMLWFGWHSIFILQAAYGLVVVLFAWRYLPEINTLTGPRKIAFLGDYRTVLSHRRARPFIVTIMFSSFSFFCFLTAIPFVYIRYFGASEQLFGILFGMNVGVLMLANFINSRLVTRVGAPRMLLAGLTLALVSVSILCVFNYIGLGLWFIVAIIAPLMAGLSLVTTNTDAIVIMKFPDHSGTASAVMGTLKFGSGALAGPLLTLLFTGTALPFSLLMLAGVIGILVCQIWAGQQRYNQPVVASEL